MDTDFERLSAAFADFRRMGYFARMAQQDGWCAVPEDILFRVGKVVFYLASERHVLSAGTLKKPLHLRCFIRDVDEVMSVLIRRGFAVERDPSIRGGVVVFPAGLGD